MSIIAKCGCSGSTCACKVQGSSGVEVTGTGTAQDPYLVSLGDLDISSNFEVDDTTSLNLTLVGAGTDVDPFVLSGVVVTGVDVTNVPTNGGNVSIDADTNLLYMNHAATIAGYTINLPDATNSFLSEITFISRSIVTTLSVLAPGAGTDVAGMPTTIAANGYFKVRLVGTTWRRVG